MLLPGKAQVFSAQAMPLAFSSSSTFSGGGQLIVFGDGVCLFHTLAVQSFLHIVGGGDGQLAHRHQHGGVKLAALEIVDAGAGAVDGDDEVILDRQALRLDGVDDAAGLVVGLGDEAIDLRWVESMSVVML